MRLRIVGRGGEPFSRSATLAADGTRRIRLAVKVAQQQCLLPVKDE